MFKLILLVVLCVALTHAGLNERKHNVRNANDKAIDGKVDNEGLTKRLIASQRRLRRENKNCTQETFDRDYERLTREQKKAIRSKIRKSYYLNENLNVTKYCDALCSANITLNPPLVSCPQKA